MGRRRCNGGSQNKARPGGVLSSSRRLSFPRRFRLPARTIRRWYAAPVDARVPAVRTARPVTFTGA